MKTKTVYCMLSPPIASATATVIGSDTVAIRWKLIDNYPETIVCYKVEWSLSTDFSEIEGVKLTGDVMKTEITIKNLKRGLKYAFRISAGFQRGFCVPCRIKPELVVISSWEDVEGCRRTDPCETTKIERDFEKNCSTPLWQTVFPSTSETPVKRKKSGLRNLFSFSTRFLKNAQRGLHLATVVFSGQKVLCTTDDCLPILSIDEALPGLSKEDFYWAMKLSLCWDSVQFFNDNRECCSLSAQFRAKFLDAVSEMQTSLGIKNIGRLHPQILSHNESGAAFLTSVVHVREQQIIQGSSMRWVSLNKLRRKHTPAAVDFLHENVKNLVNFHECSQRRLQKGLHLCYLKLHSSLDTVSVVVPEKLPAMLPSAFIRENPHVTKEEWDWLRLLEEKRCQKPNQTQLNFNNSILKAGRELFKKLNIDDDLMSMHRIYRFQIFEIEPEVSVILLVPELDDVCSPPSCSAVETDLEEAKRSCISLSIPIFEMIHYCAYNKDFLRSFTRLSLQIEHLNTIAQYEQRNCLSDDDSQLYNAVLERLRDFQQRLINLWLSARWLYNVATEARDKNAKCSVAMRELLKFEIISEDTETVQEAACTIDSSEGTSSDDSTIDGCENDSLNGLRSLLPLSDDATIMEKRKQSVGTQAASAIRVYAAYPCGFAKGTSVRLQISSCTAAREVVGLVVTQLAKAAAAAKIIKREDVNLHDYCLVVVIGSRERRLRDDFPLLKLQNPWTKGRLFVRRRDRVLEAIQFGNEASV